jgi:oxygen-independent coproporphyrinogen-3 oxidase
MITINTNNEKLLDELNLVVKLFYTTEEIDEKDIEFNIEQSVDGLDIYTKCTNSLTDTIIERNDTIKDIKFPDRYTKRYAKLAIFECLQSFFPNKVLPWGSLTGIRPTKLYYELIKECGSPSKAMDELVDTFKVTLPKAQLVREIIKNQKHIIKNDFEKGLFPPEQIALQSAYSSAQVARIIYENTEDKTVFSDKTFKPTYLRSSQAERNLKKID